jgi:hypothetical protein
MIAGTQLRQNTTGSPRNDFRLGRVPNIRQFGGRPIKAGFIAPDEKDADIAPAAGTILVDPSSARLQKGCFMSKFYINFRNGDQIARDPEGAELPDLDAAKEAAMNSVRELLADNLKAASKAGIDAVIITDESGQELATIVAKDILNEPFR